MNTCCICSSSGCSTKIAEPSTYLCNECTEKHGIELCKEYIGFDGSTHIVLCVSCGVLEKNISIIHEIYTDISNIDSKIVNNKNIMTTFKKNPHHVRYCLCKMCKNLLDENRIPKVIKGVPFSISGTANSLHCDLDRLHSSHLKSLIELRNADEVLENKLMERIMHMEMRMEDIQKKHDDTLSEFAELKIKHKELIKMYNSLLPKSSIYKFNTGECISIVQDTDLTKKKYEMITSININESLQTLRDTSDNIFIHCIIYTDKSDVIRNALVSHVYKNNITNENDREYFDEDLDISKVIDRILSICKVLEYDYNTVSNEELEKYNRLTIQ